MTESTVVCNDLGYEATGRLLKHYNYTIKRYFIFR